MLKLSYILVRKHLKCKFYLVSIICGHNCGCIYYAYLCEYCIMGRWTLCTIYFLNLKLPGCPIVTTTVVDLCNSNASLSGASFNVPAREYMPGRYFAVVCSNVTEVIVSKEGHVTTTEAVSSPLPETLNICMDCAG